MAEMKSSGIEYEERMERLAEVEPHNPRRNGSTPASTRSATTIPWVGGDNVRPKSIVRDMFERA